MHTHGEHDHDHDHDDPHTAPLTETQLRVKALESLLTEKGLVDPKALDVLSKSYVELKVLGEEPDVSKLYTEAFLPRK